MLHPLLLRCLSSDTESEWYGNLLELMPFLLQGRESFFPGSWQEECCGSAICFSAAY